MGASSSPERTVLCGGQNGSACLLRRVIMEFRIPTSFRTRPTRPVAQDPPEFISASLDAGDEQNGRSGTDSRPALPDVCEQIITSIPESHRGQRRLRYLAEQTAKLSPKRERALRDHVNQFVRRTLELDASDMDLGGRACDGNVWYRVDGEKRREDEFGAYDPLETDILVLNLLNEQQTQQLLEAGATDFSYRLEDVTGEDGRPRRFRATAYSDYDHAALNMRAITDEVFALEDLGFHEKIQQGMMFRHVRDGLTLITGVTGSGKSTTLDAIIDANNEDFPGHVVVIAQPVEYMHKPKQCIVRHREVGKDVATFKTGITQALRQDPDIVVIGEMRDPATIQAALEITDSGHKVFSTLHTSSAMETIDRIVAEVPPEEQQRVRHRLADVLRCVISQQLLPKIGGGRQMAKEVLWVDSSARAAIKNDNVGEVYQMMWEGGNQGQTTLEQDLYRLVRKKKIKPEHAMDYANNKKRLRRLF
ncbi:type IV pilus twitching motility protein PilT [Salinibacter sp.]|uniref:type IV pilus twitching motility protein PilT n=1 Tax=Salinibacter sp. TaxID=2065818 RepID=UPI003D752E36